MRIEIEAANFSVDAGSHETSFGFLRNLWLNEETAVCVCDRESAEEVAANFVCNFGSDEEAANFLSKPDADEEQ